jgi:hypothetical protein
MITAESLVVEAREAISAKSKPGSTRNWLRQIRAWAEGSQRTARRV